ncbi:hypothetical protein HRR83_001513 [Exophiala dermatitidis]|uniref:Uncharacterized protein n=2 Tax=Exophiala dermatitidis TaxID=5970 RepID=H6C671_EXODN|nr:uncharacterized protein HMPREF1120_07212 [Exophiala dermatitidis NIH/UT8656]KAJ4526321.1 hypothetical protein HRR74_001517 [Exophiala dermatitidis]EHY59217.1 hypothetical protein HMPREF1120_07212 [Exophiala dermatitidis NIH/UT8656]KAJ4526736.1 hypothetical protein HRR73_001530 [Exophiala dermatitidis]KAJ4532441.1 hypothetical protein HRR76_007433 [Exophiala dermatitidis]KAJ4547052.1 hypothetical protein HRR77_004586 [Exophiala dermatitidis]
MDQQEIQLFHNLLYELIVTLKEPELGGLNADIAVDIVLEMERRLRNHHSQQERHGLELEEAKTRVAEKSKQLAEVRRLKRARSHINNQLKALLGPQSSDNNSNLSAGGKGTAKTGLTHKRGASWLENPSSRDDERSYRKKYKQQSPTIKMEDAPEAGPVRKKGKMEPPPVKRENVPGTDPAPESPSAHCLACSHTWKQRPPRSLICPHCNSDFVILLFDPWQSEDRGSAYRSSAPRTKD